MSISLFRGSGFLRSSLFLTSNVYRANGLCLSAFKAFDAFPYLNEKPLKLSEENGFRRKNIIITVLSFLHRACVQMNL